MSSMLPESEAIEDFVLDELRDFYRTSMISTSL